MEGGARDGLMLGSVTTDRSLISSLHDLIPIPRRKRSLKRRKRMIVYVCSCHAVSRYQQACGNCAEMHCTDCTIPTLVIVSSFTERSTQDIVNRIPQSAFTSHLLLICKGCIKTSIQCSECLDIRHWPDTGESEPDTRCDMCREKHCVTCLITIKDDVMVRKACNIKGKRQCAPCEEHTLQSLKKHIQTGVAGIVYGYI